MKTVCVVTTNRADYGILTPLIKRINEDEELELWLVATGAHFSEKYGNTIYQIEEDGFPIKARLPILETGNEPYDISVTVSNAIKTFAEFFRTNKPDLLVLLGDRTEMLGVAIAAMNENIVIAHLHGGEVTEGAVDDCVRHALTKMSYLHFAGTEVYRKRIIQLGENPDRVYNVGTLSAENILSVPLMTEDEVRKDIGIPDNQNYAVVTLHPETIDSLSPQDISNILCESMRKFTDCYYVITASNSDVGGDVINTNLRNFAAEHDNVQYIESLGMKRYLSAVKYAMFVLGNSSSGIVEAPIIGTPTINIGNRQKGRLMAETIINVPFDEGKILTAMQRAEQIAHMPSNMYGEGDTSENMVLIIKKVLMENVDLKKGFHDLID